VAIPAVIVGVYIVSIAVLVKRGAGGEHRVR
jgi:hypothetical protein